MFISIFVHFNVDDDQVLRDGHFIIDDSQKQADHGEASREEVVVPPLVEDLVVLLLLAENSLSDIFRLLDSIILFSAKQIWFLRSIEQFDIT